MTTPTTTAAPASPQPKRKPDYVGVCVNDKGVTVERWERPCKVEKPAVKVVDADQGVVSIDHRPRPKEIEVRFNQEREVKVARHRTRQWDVDPSDDDGLDPADGGYANLGRDAMRASVAAGVDTRNRIRQSATWKLYAPWIGMVLFIGIAIYGYGEPRGWFGVDSSRTNSAVSPKTNRSVDGANAAGGGTNNCRTLLEKWRRGDQRFNWTDADAVDVDAAIRADGGRP